ncbi:MAG: class I SAM-dependent methyltransferase [Hyphomonas sp.]|uniref:class I SAM-dependent methyltransferase n=1 Tax=Hyphomonas sp. TaxID=87 RepID=UPI00352868DF
MNNKDQIDYWNGPAGQRWVDQSNRLDAMLAPFADAVIARAALQPGEAVIDVGCGAGALTLLAAKAVGEGRGALGVDVSEPLVSLARRRAAEAGLPARFDLADASEFDTADKADIMVSRFGVMFFADPGEAFANIRRAVRPGGRLTFVCWQGLDKNDWALKPLLAGLPFLKEPPPQPDPSAPGPFAFHDRDRVARFLGEAGWSDVTLDSIETELILPGEDIAANAGFMMQLGPLSRLMAAQGIAPAPVEAALADLMRANERADGTVAMRAACWLVSAGNP